MDQEKSELLNMPAVAWVQELYGKAEVTPDGDIVFCDTSWRIPSGGVNTVLAKAFEGEDPLDPHSNPEVALAKI